MIKKIFSLAIIQVFLLIGLSYGQGNYKEGYIIDRDRKIISGDVSFDKGLKNPEKIFFKTSASNRIQELTPLDIIGFGLDDIVYESAIIQVDDALKIDTSFLLVIIRGDKSLYYLDYSGQDKFYIKDDSGFQLLVNDGYSRDYQGNFFSSGNINYLDQLTNYMSDCSAVQPSIGKTKYKLKSMKELFDDYYYFKGSKYDYKLQDEKAKINLGVKVGVSLTEMSFKPNKIDPLNISTQYDYLIKSNFDPSKDITAGISLEVILPNCEDKLSISNDFLYSSFKFTGRYDDIQSEDVYKHHFIDVNILNIRMHNMLRYKFSVHNTCLFINGGIASAYVFKSTNQDKVLSKFWGPESEIYNSAIPEYRYFTTGYVFGGGIGYKNITLEFKHEGIGGISKVKGLTASSKINFLLVGYRF